MKLRKKQPQPEGISGYDYSDRAARERMAYALFRRAKNARTAVEIEWEKYNDYYNGIHDVTRDLTEFCRENDIRGSRRAFPIRISSSRASRTDRAAAGISRARRRS